MKYLRVPPQQYHRKTISYFMKSILLAGVLITPQSALADDLSDCLSKRMQQAHDSTIIGEFRSECEKQIKNGTT